jgi:hypothetical protein
MLLASTPTDVSDIFQFRVSMKQRIVKCADIPRVHKGNRNNENRVSTETDEDRPKRNSVLTFHCVVSPSRIDLAIIEKQKYMLLEKEAIAYQPSPPRYQCSD